MLPRIFFLLAVASTAFAQNSDLGLMLGASIPVSNSVSAGTVSTSVEASAAIEYAFQLRDTHAGRLYLELPLLITGTASDVVAPGTVSSAVHAALFFTPGPRWQFSPASRVSFHGAGGAGLAIFNRTFSFVGNGRTLDHIGTTVSLGIDVGGGMDLRLTRLVSLRIEGRDAITGSRFDGHVNHTLVLLGVGLHF